MKSWQSLPEQSQEVLAGQQRSAVVMLQLQRAPEGERSLNRRFSGRYIKVTPMESEGKGHLNVSSHFTPGTYR